MQPEPEDVLSVRARLSFLLSGVALLVLLAGVVYLLIVAPLPAVHP